MPGRDSRSATRRPPPGLLAAGGVRPTEPASEAVFLAAAHGFIVKNVFSARVLGWLCCNRPMLGGGGPEEGIGMKAFLITVSACGVLTLPAVAAAKPPGAAALLTPVQALGAAIAPRRRALEGCGIRFTGAGRKVVVGFKLAFDGSVRDLRVSGLPAKSAAGRCVRAQFEKLKLPARLSFIIRDIALPLRLVAAAPVKAKH